MLLLRSILVARCIRGLIGGVLLASVTFAVSAAGQEVCVADDVTTCPPVGDDAGLDPDMIATPADATVPGDASIPDAQPTPASQRTIGPPTVVQPFAGVAVSAADVDEPTPARVQPADHQKLPPGPPGRFP